MTSPSDSVLEPNQHASYRMVAGVEYNGNAYHGFQIQSSGVPTVQAALHEAFSKIADHSISIVCAGRTDAGVHASGQVVHFDATASRSEKAWVVGANSVLPKDISVRWAKVVPDTFHARFTARGRRYRYVIYNDACRPAIGCEYITWHRALLDVKKMQEAANYLIGEQDFTSFRSSECQAAQPIRIIRELIITQHDAWIIVEIEATAFLHNMVRNIVGTLYEVGMNKKSPSWVGEVLAARDRTKGGATAPPTGLYLVDVTYPAEFALPKMNLGPSFLNVKM
jgi:tRNA pseudouridine38-40 synthase